jgi:biotin carboxyl carrier protein
MLKKLRITIDNKVYSVVVEDVTESILHSPITSPPAVQQVLPVHVKTADIAKPLVAPSLPSLGEGDETAPLSGVISSIEVALGQAVKEGDKIVVIEAMKMKTAVYAHRTGSISRILVKAGDGVEAGQALLSISSAGE